MIYAPLSPYGYPKVVDAVDAGGNKTVTAYRMRNRAFLKALTVDILIDGVAVQLDDGSRWRYVAASTAVDALEQFVLAPAPVSPEVAPTTGRWVRLDASVDLEMPITFATADAAVLYTVPAGFTLRLSPSYFDVTTAFTGGTSSAIGASSSNAAYNTKGDLLGGAAGDVLAGLTAGAKRGNAGAKYASGGQIVLGPGDTIRHDRVTSAFTAGAGKIVQPVRVLSAPASL